MIINTFRSTLKLILISIAASLLVATHSWAANNQSDTYQIEMIVFSAINNDTLSSEHWPVITPSDFQLADIQSPNYLNYLQRIHFTPATKQQQLLSKEQSKLSSNRNFHVIAQLAWQEIVPSSQQSQPIRIYGGNAYGTDGNLLATQPNPTVALNTYPQWQLNGEVTISLNRYFDTRFNLVFAEPTNALPSSFSERSAAANTPVSYFHLLQTRRTKSDELNYIDNPLYRVLFIIKKISAHSNNKS